MRQCRLLASLLLVSLAAAPRARALLTFENANPYAPPDLVTVSATESFGYDSNVFAQKVAQGSVSESFSCGANYVRRAGEIDVTVDASLNSVYYGSLQQQNAENPDYSVTFSKGEGRTTGSLNFEAQRTDQPDPIANNRAIAWNYSSALDLRYPVMGRYYLTNLTSVAGTYYTNRAIFTDLDSVTNDLALNYKFDSKLDLDSSYRFSVDDTDNTRAYDQAWLVGATGSLTSKWSGTIDLGYDYRPTSYTDGVASEAYTGVTADANVAWRFSRTLTFTGTASKDFNISSTDITTDTTSFGLSGDTSIGKRLRANLGLNYIGTDFLGPDSLGRKDKLWELQASLRTSVTTHINTSIVYDYMINYSNISTAVFKRETLSWVINASY